MVFIGSYTIAGVEVSLVMTVTYREDSAIAKIYLPEDYPFTRLKVALYNRPLFEVRVGYLPHGLPYYSQQDVDTFFSRYGIDLREPTLHILNIRINARAVPNLLPDEKSMIKGLGKKAFCRAIPVLSRYWGLVASNPITLTAAGGMISTEEDRERIKEYEKEDRIQLAKKLLRLRGCYPGMENYAPEMTRLLRESVPNLSRSLVTAENNLRLVDYYSRVWKMKSIAHKGFYYDMGTSLGRLEEACGFNTIYTKY